MTFIVLYINCTRGKFIAHGPFNTEYSAWIWINKQVNPGAFAVLMVNRP